MVATKLPRDLAAWADLGFVQASVVTGTPDVDVPIRRPLVQIDAWAHSPDGVKPPVNKAARLAELVRVATELPTAKYSTPVAMPANYAGAVVLSVWPASEPAEVTDDPSGFARITFDLELRWARA